MKKTLQEEKERFRQIVEQGSENMSLGFKPNELSPKDDYERTSTAQTGFRMELKELMGKYTRILGNHGITDALQSAITEMKDSDDASNKEMLNTFKSEKEAPISQETDEYAKTYDNNMSQGFIHESVILNGKSYKLTISKKKK